MGGFLKRITDSFNIFAVVWRDHQVREGGDYGPKSKKLLKKKKFCDPCLPGQRRARGYR